MLEVLHHKITDTLLLYFPNNSYDLSQVRKVIPKKDAIKNNEFVKQKINIYYAYGININLCYTDIIVLDIDDVYNDYTVVSKLKELKLRYNFKDLTKIELVQTSTAILPAEIYGSPYDIPNRPVLSTTLKTNNYHAYLYFDSYKDRRQEFNDAGKIINICPGFVRNIVNTNSMVIRVSKKFNVLENTNLIPILKYSKVDNEWKENTYSEPTPPSITSVGTSARSQTLNLRS
jgi:hypothetical protein